MKKFKPLAELESVYNAVKPAQENDHAAFVWFTGVPDPFFNAVMHLNLNQNLSEKVDRLMSQVPESCFWAHEENHPDLYKILLKKGLKKLMDCPLMTCPVKSMGLTDYEVRLGDLEIFHQMLATAFHFNDAVKYAFAKLLENAEAENYIVYFDGKPAGTGTLIPEGQTGGIFNIATLPEYQKRGCGRAMVSFIMQRAFELKLENLVLLSSLAAEGLYTDLGFTKCFNIEIFTK